MEALYAGVFLENELSTSVRKFEETFRLFAKGDTVLPRLGIGEIPKQMAKQLPDDSIFLSQEVQKVMESTVVMTDGKEWSGRAVVLATEELVTNRLIGIDEPIQNGMRLIASTSVCPKRNSP